MRRCFTTILTKFRDKFLHKKKNPFLFALSGSSGLGKSSFGIILLLFIANAVVVSNLKKSNINEDKYSQFFPQFDLKLKRKKKKGFAILYWVKNRRFLALFRNERKCWTYSNGSDENNLNRYFEMLSDYDCFFIIDRLVKNLNIESLAFDGVIILIGSPKVTFSSKDIYKNEFISKCCLFYPLWEPDEFKIFTDYFKLSNKFNPQEISGLESEMGLNDLNKTDVYGNNPRKIMSQSEVIDLTNLLEAVKSKEVASYLRESGSSNDLLNKSFKDVIHRIFFIKPSDDLLTCSSVFVSSYVQCLLTRHISYLKTSDALKNYRECHELENPSLSGINYETYFHAYINERRNRKIKIERQFNRGTSTFSLFEKTFCFTIKSYIRTDSIRASLSNKFYCPIKFNYATFDSVFGGNVKQYIKNNRTSTSKNVVCFFQCTVGLSHPFSRDNYYIMENSLNLKGVDEVCLIFIVPNCSISFNAININDINPKINIYMARFS
jgi:hypothetical protein